jgi:hypothetical protein
MCHPALTGEPGRSRIRISFPVVFWELQRGHRLYHRLDGLTVVSIPPANLAILHIVSKLCSMCRGYHVAIFRLLPHRIGPRYAFLRS